MQSKEVEVLKLGPETLSASRTTSGVHSRADSVCVEVTRVTSPSAARRQLSFPSCGIAHDASAMYLRDELARVLAAKLLAIQCLGPPGNLLSYVAVDTCTMRSPYRCYAWKAQHLIHTTAPHAARVVTQHVPYESQCRSGLCSELLALLDVALRIWYLILGFVFIPLIKLLSAQQQARHAASSNCSKHLEDGHSLIQRLLLVRRQLAEGQVLLNAILAQLELWSKHTDKSSIRKVFAHARL